MSRSGQKKKSEHRSGGSAPLSFADFFGALLVWIGALPEALRKRTGRLSPRAKGSARERKADRFPESDNRAMQMLLVFPAMLRMWRSLVRERLFRRRRRSLGFDTAVAVRTTHQNRVRPLVFVAVALIFACVAVFFSIYTPATTVSYNGRTLEIVSDAAEAKKIAAHVEGITAQTLGGSFAFSADSVQYTSSLVRRSEVGGAERLEKQLTDEVGLVTYGYSLYIDDELVGSTQYEGALEALIDQMKQIGVTGDTLSVDFVEDVRIVPGYVATNSLKNLGEIAEKINSTKVGEVTYTVISGDTWGQIAYDHGMSNAQLLELNPGYDIDRINIGDELVLSREIPYLTVRVTERQNYVDEVNYEIVYVDDSTMYQGDTRVIEKGEYGTADIVADVIYVNGVETERTVLSQVMLTAPKTETRARGTKERPSWMPTGSFRWPVYGRITSGFGYRNTGIRGASTYHQGIDIACSYGTTIVAADGGTVIYTGYKGAMGYTVIIDHGNGYKTYYEHCSSFLCSSGQHVYKGQSIARVGSTGVSSGPHCHFGILKNGVYVNPLNYLP
ncbi:MAG: peptidoglycan DD-metalloendopeptidase family protein [Oscillospiraceae bacterium]|nr:peptidoglycan DD-metalloendopeptidase family protein [Oscillospiraceae bacterium]